MKLRNIVRITLLGLGAALLLAGSAYARQDMDPTDFPINPGTPQIERSAVQPTTQSVESAKAVSAENLVSTTGMLAVQVAMAIVLFAGIAWLTLYTTAAMKRDCRLYPILEDSPYRSSSATTR